MTWTRHIASIQNKLHNTSKKVAHNNYGERAAVPARQRRGRHQLGGNSGALKTEEEDAAYLGRLLGAGEPGGAGSLARRTSSPSSKIRVLFHSSVHFHPLRQVTRINTRKLLGSAAERGKREQPAHSSSTGSVDQLF